MIIGNGQINIGACTPAEERQNWATIQQNFTSIFNTLDSGGVDAFTVYIDNSTTGDTPDYLHAKLYYHGTFNGGIHQPVYAEVYNDSGVIKERLYTLKTDDEGAVDNFTVMCTGTDSVPAYLHDSIEDTDSFFVNTDILVKSQTISHSGNEKERFFLDVSEINGYEESDLWFLALDNNISKYMLIDDLASNIVDHFFDNVTLDGLEYDDTTNTLASIPAAQRAVTNSIATKASGIVGGSITPGVGTAVLYNPPAANSAAGTAWTFGSQVTYENWIHSPIPSHKPILLRPSRVISGVMLYEIVTDGCKSVPTSL